VILETLTGLTSDYAVAAGLYIECGVAIADLATNYVYSS